MTAYPALAQDALQLYPYGNSEHEHQRVKFLGYSNFENIVDMDRRTDGVQRLMQPRNMNLERHCRCSSCLTPDASSCL